MKTEEETMRRISSRPFLMVLAVLAWTATGCAKKEASTDAPPAQAQATPAAPAGDGKIPITTTSAEARAEFVEGRDLVEKLKVTDSVAHFQKAAALDPTFAWAELSLANSAPTGKEFFEHLDKAVALSEKASNGERLLIQATKAGANGDAVGQIQKLEELVGAYPNDERAHFNLGGTYFGQQDYAKAIEHYKKATEINPAYATAYNILGYAYRQSGDFASA
jgi:tetratricopeptide (TPR) repeat protein